MFVCLFVCCIFRAKAKAVTDVIVDIEEVLTKTTMTQKAAKDAIDAAEGDIKTAEDILNKVRAYMFRDVRTSNVVLFFGFS